MTSAQPAIPLLEGSRTERDQAEALGICLATLRRWRKQGKGPPFTTLGRKFLYDEDSTRRWLLKGLGE